MRFADLDAVTIDAFGTLVELRDPVGPLDLALRSRGVEREPDAIATAFRAEAEYYVPRSATGRDEASLALLRRDCAAVFLDALDAPLDPASFAAPYVEALEFAPVQGALPAVHALRRRGLALAVVSNWDVGLAEHLDALGVGALVDMVVTSAEAGAPKPDPAVFELALDRLRVAAERTLHVGDSEADEEGARAAGLRFAPAPLAAAVQALA
jgi:HAD superfamily hydrolase (TIGR01509 family)